MTSRFSHSVVRALCGLTAVWGGLQACAENTAPAVLTIHEVPADPTDDFAATSDRPAPTLAPTRAAPKASAVARPRNAPSMPSAPDALFASRSLFVPHAVSAPAVAPSVAPIPPTADKGLLDKVAGDVELVTDRYPDGSVRVERQVSLDAAGNFVNHGGYTAYDVNGQVVEHGRYVQGKLDGHWVRTLRAEEANRFSADIGKGFRPPIIAEADFKDGTLSGLWVLKSQNQQKIVLWNFVGGVCHGEATWFLPNGEKRAQLAFKHGVPDGDFLEWDEAGNAANQGKFIEGRLLTHMVRWHAPGQKAFEGYYLKPQTVDVPSPAWWTGAETVASKDTQANLSKQGVPGARHGQWTAWYPNGQKQSQGEFRDDLPTGKFVWWYANGQKQAEGQYANGVEDGNWITWYSNGQRETVKQYQAGEVIGKALCWDQTGRLVDVHDLASAAGEQRSVPGNLGTGEGEPTVGAAASTRR